MGISQGLEEARNIMEGMRSLRPEVLETLLINCLRVKVRWICVQWAEELGLERATAANQLPARPNLSLANWESCSRLILELSQNQRPHASLPLLNRSGGDRREPDG